MRILLPGATGQAGTILARFFHAPGDDVTVLSRIACSSHLLRGKRNHGHQKGNSEDICHQNRRH